MGKFKEQDLNIICESYGEAFAKFCRTNFPTILEEKGMLCKCIKNTFSECRALFEDLEHNRMLEDFVEFIDNVYAIEKKAIKIDNSKPSESPEVLMDKAGYKLFKCETKQDIQKFAKYYEPSELICTFDDPKRLDTHIVFFAVKKDVDKIKREDFFFPLRQDKYGTSVISIQFQKGFASRLSIKNRYNHTVDNPDATFSNNLEKIIPGLTKSFAEHYGLRITREEFYFDCMPDYLLACDGKYYRYNYAFEEISYCPNNIVLKNNEVKQYDTSRYEVFDYFILDKQEKKLFSSEKDAFLDAFWKDGYSAYGKNCKNRSIIEKTEIVKIKGTQNKLIQIWVEGKTNPAEIVIDKNKQILSYKNPNISRIGNDFLKRAKRIEKVDLPNVIRVGDSFCEYTPPIKEINLPNVEQIGNYFCRASKDVEELNFPRVKKIGNKFLELNINLSKLNAPNLEHVGFDFCKKNIAMKELELPKLSFAWKNFFRDNIVLTKLSMPSITTFGEGGCMYYYAHKDQFLKPNNENMEK